MRLRLGAVCPALCVCATNCRTSTVGVRRAMRERAPGCALRGDVRVPKSVEFHPESVESSHWLVTMQSHTTLFPTDGSRPRNRLPVRCSGAVCDVFLQRCFCCIRCATQLAPRLLSCRLLHCTAQTLCPACTLPASRFYSCIVVQRQYCCPAATCRNTWVLFDSNGKKTRGSTALTHWLSRRPDECACVAGVVVPAAICA